MRRRRLEPFTLEEIWRPVVGFPNYEVSNYGSVRQIHRGRRMSGHEVDRLMRPRSNGKDVLQLNLYREGGQFTVPLKRIVLETFRPAPKHLREYGGTMMRHINGDWMDCRVHNLNWATRTNALLMTRWKYRSGVPVRAVLEDLVFEDEVDAAEHYKWGNDIDILKSCMEWNYGKTEFWHCGERFEWV